MNFGQPEQEETKLQKVWNFTQEAVWVIGTSLFVLAFPIYVARKLK